MCSLALGLLIAAAPSASGTAADDSKTPAPSSQTSAAGSSAAASKPTPQLGDYVREIEQIRKAAFTSSVTKGTQSLAEFRKFVQRDVDTDLPPPRAACVSKALASLGLLPERFDLRKAVSDLLVSQVAAYYNPYKKTFYIVHANLPESFLHPIVVHEMTHALQDQRFGLAARLKALRGAGNEDRENAFRFLAEGEATYVMTIATLRGQGIDPDISTQLVDWTVDITNGLGRKGIQRQVDSARDVVGEDAAAEMDTLLSYPDYLFRVLFDPYFSGQSAVHHVYRKGGWAAVDELWRNPPTTTEMFLHPEKLEGGRREAPIEVSVPDLSAALGSGAHPTCEGTLGELETEILLETNLPLGPSGTSPANEIPAPPRGPAAAPSITSSSTGGAAGSSESRPQTSAAPLSRDDAKVDPSETGGQAAIRHEGSSKKASSSSVPEPPADSIAVDPQRPSVMDPKAAAMADLPSRASAAKEAGARAVSPAASPSVTPDSRAAQETLDLDQARVDRARAAAAGWGGDRYRSFETQDGATIVVWQTAWDTEADAIEFEAAMRDVAARQGARPDGGPAMIVVRRGSEVTCIAGASKIQGAAAVAALEMPAARRTTAPVGTSSVPCGSATPAEAPIEPSRAGVRPRP